MSPDFMPMKSLSIICPFNLGIKKALRFKPDSGLLISMKPFSKGTNCQTGTLSKLVIVPKSALL